MDTKQRITAQVLNGATGEFREVVTQVSAGSEQDAVDKLFAYARRDDYYYRFLGMSGVISPSKGATPVPYQSMIYWAREGANG